MSVFYILFSSRLQPEEMSFRFGQHLIKPSVVFLKTELSFALVNRKPVVPGRILFFFFFKRENRPNEHRHEPLVSNQKGKQGILLPPPLEKPGRTIITFILNPVGGTSNMLDQRCKTSENELLSNCGFGGEFLLDLFTVVAV